MFNKCDCYRQKIIKVLKKIVKLPSGHIINGWFFSLWINANSRCTVFNYAQNGALDSDSVKNFIFLLLRLQVGNSISLVKETLNVAFNCKIYFKLFIYAVTLPASLTPSFRDPFLFQKCDASVLVYSSICENYCPHTLRMLNNKCDKCSF